MVLRSQIISQQGMTCVQYIHMKTYNIYKITRSCSNHNPLCIYFIISRTNALLLFIKNTRSNKMLKLCMWNPTTLSVWHCDCWHSRNYICCCVLRPTLCVPKWIIKPSHRQRLHVCAINWHTLPHITSILSNLNDGRSANKGHRKPAPACTQSHNRVVHTHPLNLFRFTHTRIIAQCESYTIMPYNGLARTLSAPIRHYNNCYSTFCLLALNALSLCSSMCVCVCVQLHDNCKILQTSVGGVAASAASLTHFSNKHILTLTSHIECASNV